ncbi:hypothetical protein HCN44_010272 [Aphidius gifuensis]|uniref:Uncharacterized protein n=1 Tax=Aphidius gifuensis TaxID=684658 RepID=A0A835CRU7_APHGI|nr:hypothetical protein HCN44_010272 [Aphidius gifuensis]
MPVPSKKKKNQSMVEEREILDKAICCQAIEIIYFLNVDEFKKNPKRLIEILFKKNIKKTIIDDKIIKLGLLSLQEPIKNYNIQSYKNQISLQSKDSNMKKLIHHLENCDHCKYLTTIDEETFTFGIGLELGAKRNNLIAGIREYLKNRSRRFKFPIMNENNIGKSIPRFDKILENSRENLNLLLHNENISNKQSFSSSKASADEDNVTEKSIVSNSSGSKRSYKRIRIIDSDDDDDNSIVNFYGTAGNLFSNPQQKSHTEVSSIDADDESSSIKMLSKNELMQPLACSSIAGSDDEISPLSANKLEKDELETENSFNESKEIKVTNRTCTKNDIIRDFKRISTSISNKRKSSCGYNLQLRKSQQLLNTSGMWDIENYHRWSRKNNNNRYQSTKVDEVKEDEDEPPLNNTQDENEAKSNYEMESERFKRECARFEREGARFQVFKYINSMEEKIRKCELELNDDYINDIIQICNNTKHWLTDNQNAEKQDYSDLLINMEKFYEEILIKAEEDDTEESRCVIC